MVSYTCEEPACARIFHQEPAYVNHLRKHLNNGGEYLKVLKPSRRRRAKTAKPPDPSVEKKRDPGNQTKSQKTITPAVEKKRKRDDGKKLEMAKEEWAARQKRKRNRPRVYKRIASGKVGVGSDQAEVIDLRTPSPSRSPSVEMELVNENQQTPPRTFTLSPDTTCPSRQTTLAPDHQPISENAILALHQSNVSRASPAVPTERQCAGSQPEIHQDRNDRQTSEATIIALNHHSACSPSRSPTASNSEKHDASPAFKPKRKRARKSARATSTISDTSISAISESSVISLHHLKASQSTRSPIALLSSGGPNIRSIPKQSFSQIVSHLPTPPSTPTSVKKSKDLHADVDTIPTTATISEQMPVPSPHPAPSEYENDFIHCTPHQASGVLPPPVSPISSVTQVSRLSDIPIPITPTRLGATWKTETAPPSEIADEEFDELESDHGDISMIPAIFDDNDRLGSPYTPVSATPSLTSLYTNDSNTSPTLSTPSPVFHSQAEVDTTSWATALDNPKQWGGSDILSPSLEPPVALVDHDLDDAGAEEEECHSTDPGTSSEESDDSDIDDEYGYRVFAGFSDLDSVDSAQWGGPALQTTSGQVTGPPSFRSLSPKRPTALEATNGVSHRISLSLELSKSSTGELSAELASPISISPLKKTHEFDWSSDWTKSLNINKSIYTSSSPNSSSPQPSHVDDSKRDQVLLALLQAGHVDLAQEMLQNGIRGATSDAA